MCPDMSRKQKDALAYGVKVPIVYTNVQIRNSIAFEKLGVRRIKCPGSYFTTIEMDYPVSMGGYKYPAMFRRPMHIAYSREFLAVTVPPPPSANRRAYGAIPHAICDLRAQHPQPIEARSLARRFRSSAGYSSDHRESLAARLRVRIQLALDPPGLKTNAPVIGAAALRQNFDC